MASIKCINSFVPEYFCTSRGSVYDLVARKLKRWNNPFIYSTGTGITFRES